MKKTLAEKKKKKYTHTIKVKHKKNKKPYFRLPPNTALNSPAGPLSRVSSFWTSQMPMSEGEVHLEKIYGVERERSEGEK